MSPTGNSSTPPSTVAMLKDLGVEKIWTFPWNKSWVSACFHIARTREQNVPDIRTQYSKKVSTGPWNIPLSVTPKYKSWNDFLGWGPGYVEFFLEIYIQTAENKLSDPLEGSQWYRSNKPERSHTFNQELGSRKIEVLTSKKCKHL